MSKNIKMIGEVLRRAELWIIIGFVAVFVTIIWSMDDKDAVELFNGIYFSIAIGVLVTYAPAFYRALMDRKKQSSDFLLLGIALSWTVIALQRGLATIWRALDKPPWLADHWVWGAFIFMGIIAGTLHITAPHAVDGRVPTRNWVRWGLFVACGTAGAVTFIWWMRSAAMP